VFEQILKFIHNIAIKKSLTGFILRKFQIFMHKIAFVMRIASLGFCVCYENFL